MSTSATTFPIVEPSTPKPAPTRPVPTPVAGAGHASIHAPVDLQTTHPLCAAISRGDRAAFATFYNAWFDRCYAMARSLTRRDESFCLDVVQNTMLRVARAIKPIDSDAALSRWMVRAVHSSAIDLLRAESRARRRDRAAARPDLAPAHDPHLADWLAATLASLDERERALLNLRFARDATFQTIAHAERTTPDAAHGRIRRLLARLRSASDPPA